MTEQQRGGPADVVYVLVLVQVAAGLLALVGAVVMTGGNPVYAAVPLLKTVVMLLVAGAVRRRGRPWSLITLIVVELMTVVGFWISAVAGLLRELDHTVNLVGLLTGVGLPVAICWLCAQLLAAQPRRPRQSHQAREVAAR
ncbi:MAG TPA: hypothetical protein VFR67_31230 [Pilimelia sp.]|nr:hypothetical protein [Pilimelia sp.]